MHNKYRMIKFIILSVLLLMGTSTSVQAHSPDEVMISVEAINTPTIDGVISNGEWGDPVLDTWMNYTSFSSGNSETHKFIMYIMNDKVNLYIGIIIYDEDFNTTDSYDVLELYFDSNHNGIQDTFEDVKSIRISDYQDGPFDLTLNDRYFHEDGYTTSDTQNDGKAVGKHTNQEIGDYVFEFEIPLNSGDPQDISVNSGDTLGLYITYTEMKLMDGGYTQGDGWENWPLNALDAYHFDTYGDLVLVQSDIEPQTNSLQLDTTKIGVHNDDVLTYEVITFDCSGFDQDLCNMLTEGEIFSFKVTDVTLDSGNAITVERTNSTHIDIEEQISLDTMDIIIFTDWDYWGANAAKVFADVVDAAEPPPLELITIDNGNEFLNTSLFFSGDLGDGTLLTQRWDMIFEKSTGTLYSEYQDVYLETVDSEFLSFELRMERTSYVPGEVISESSDDSTSTNSSTTSNNDSSTKSAEPGFLIVFTISTMVTIILIRRKN